MVAGGVSAHKCTSVLRGNAVCGLFALSVQCALLSWCWGRHCCREMPTVLGHSSSHGDILSVDGKRSRWGKCCSSPGRRHPHCCRQTLPLAEVLFQSGTETSSLFHWYQSWRFPRHFLVHDTSLQNNIQTEHITVCDKPSVAWKYCHMIMKCDIYIRKDCTPMSYSRRHGHVPGDV